MMSCGPGITHPQEGKYAPLNVKIYPRDLSVSLLFSLSPSRRKPHLLPSKTTLEMESSAAVSESSDLDRQRCQKGEPYRDDESNRYNP